MVNIEEIREYCLSLPLVTEDMAFGEDYLLLRVYGKIFACINLERSDWLTVKCDPDRALDLRERYRSIQPAWHWNKRYWNQIDLTSGLSYDFITSLIRHSYGEVVKKLPRKLKAATPEILAVEE